MDEQLKPCPFCGAEAEYEDVTWWGCEVRCSDPDCDAGFGIGHEVALTKQAAREKWNRRAK